LTVARLVVVGEVLVDFFAEPGKAATASGMFSGRPGGAPANLAAAAAKLGLDVTFIGKVGDDALGRSLRATLDGHAVDTSHLATDRRLPTMLALVAAAVPELPQFVLYHGANRLLAEDDIDEKVVAGADVLAFGSITLAVESRAAAIKAARLARAGGRHVVFDVNLRPTIWPDLDAARTTIAEAIATADVVKLNETELAFLEGAVGHEDGVKRILKRGPKLCCLTLGERGAYFSNGAGSGYAPGFRVRTRDTTGCGDAFAAGLSLKLAGLDRPLDRLDRSGLAAIVRFANACGAVMATELGGMEARLGIAAVDALMRVEA
jgi:sugar/nucleoside kinase (ribokinase family)